MGDADEDILVIGDAVKRPQFTIRGLMLLVLAVAAVAWVMRQPGSNEFLLKHWPLIAMVLPPLYGLVWSIRRVYRVTPRQQTLSIVCLIVSVLGLLCALVVSASFLAPWVKPSY
jgi:FtsH-binding integral membrane protein